MMILISSWPDDNIDIIQPDFFLYYPSLIIILILSKPDDNIDSGDDHGCPDNS